MIVFVKRWLAVVGVVATSVLSASVNAQHSSPTKLLLVAIGGNSECAAFKGIKKLYYPGEESDPVKGQARLGALAKSLAASFKVETSEIDPYYFSWTGDSESHSGCLPGHWDWITGGSAMIRSQLPQLERPSPDLKIVIVGWSNGGATAYELACDLALSDRSRVTLLVTLDPTSVTTRQCFDGETAIRPTARWIGVYTASTGWSKLTDSGNIIAAIGGAWDDKFPASSHLRATQLMLLEPANHGDTVPMWSTCVGQVLKATNLPTAVRAPCRTVWGKTRPSS